MSGPIGSIFATEDLPPVAHGAEAADSRELVQSGGQALRLVSADLWRSGARRLVFPGYFCETMLVPFDVQPWQVEYYAMTRDLTPDWSDVDRRLAMPNDAVLVVPEYFGSRMNASERSRLAEMSARGVRVVEDWTHSHLGPARTPIDLAIASLRKMLPVGDGGWIWGASAATAVENAVGPGELMWRAMDELAAAATAIERVAARELASTAELRFATELTPRSASARTQPALERLDLNRMGEKRQRNAQFLAARLNARDIVNRDLRNDVPSHLVLRVENPRTLQGLLAQEQIYCPVHWSRPRQAPSALVWDHLISIPIDHRYDENDMEYVAAVLNRVHD